MNDKTTGDLTVTDLLPRRVFDAEGPTPRISVLGTGYLGATHAVSMAALTRNQP